MKKITSIVLLVIMVLALTSCGKDKPKVTVEESKVENTDSGNSSSEKASVDLTKTILNSKYCDMKYEMAMPDFEYEKEYYDNTLPEHSTYTRVYKTTDKKFKYYVTEYLGTKRYVGNLDRDYGKTSHTEASGILTIIANIIQEDTGYSENMQIQDNFPMDIGNGIEIYKCCLQLPNELDDYYYVKGYIAVGIKHPVAVYFYDGTPETDYDEEMQTKSLEIIQSLKIGE